MKILVVIVAILIPTLALAADGNGISITHAWSRATVGTNVPGVAYLTIADTGSADTLIAVDTPIAAMAGLHESRTIDGVSGMTPVKSLLIAAGTTVTLAPGGYHIMLAGLTQTLKAGDQFPLTLVFEHGGKVTTTVTVKPMGTVE